MHLREPLFILVLFGLLIEVTGAFFLAAEAIGLERIQFWADVVVDLLGRARLWSFGLVLMFLYVFALALSTRYRVSEIIDGRKAGYPPWMSVSAVFLVIVYISILSFWLLNSLPRFLLFAKTSTERRSAATLGFLLLFIGFLLQFTGTLGTFVLANLK